VNQLVGNPVHYAYMQLATTWIKTVAFPMSICRRGMRPMATRHGIYRNRAATITPGDQLAQRENIGVFRVGIWGIFTALRTAQSLVSSSADALKARQLETHFRHVLERFLFGLQNLNVLMQDLARNFNKNAIQPDQRAIELQAGYHADHILTYLNTIVDDIAEVIILITGTSHLRVGKNPIESMSNLKNPTIRQDPLLASVKPQLDHLCKSNSWWGLAFERLVGARQLLIHNRYLITFGGTSTPGQPFEAQAVLHCPAGKTPIDFFAHLRAIFADLFDWLDQLEAALKTYLVNKVPSWSPTPQASLWQLPVGYPPGSFTYDPVYFPLPLCNGSDSLPWEMTVLVSAE
jgi:hypothetical protein